MRSRTIHLLAAILALTLLAASCGDDDSDNASEADTTTDSDAEVSEAADDGAEDDAAASNDASDDADGGADDDAMASDDADGGADDDAMASDDSGDGADDADDDAMASDADADDDAISETEDTIVDVAVANSIFTTLVAAVQAAGLDTTLSGEGPFTVFAPTDDAFAAALDALGLTADELLADTELLTSVLTYHVIEGEVPSATVVTMDGQTAVTVNGAEVEISVDGEER